MSGPTVKMTPTELALNLGRLRKATPEMIERCIRKAARRGQALLVGKTPTDMGQLRNSWRVLEGPSGIRLENSAPHAGIAEMGARPHKVNREGLEALAAWAQRKLGLDEAAAKKMAFALAKKIEKEGQAPTYFVRRELELLASYIGVELKREMAKLLRDTKRQQKMASRGNWTPSVEDVNTGGLFGGGE